MRLYIDLDDTGLLDDVYGIKIEEGILYGWYCAEIATAIAIHFDMHLTDEERNEYLTALAPLAHLYFREWKPVEDIIYKKFQNNIVDVSFTPEVAWWEKSLPREHATLWFGFDRYAAQYATELLVHKYIRKDVADYAEWLEEEVGIEDYDWIMEIVSSIE